MTMKNGQMNSTISPEAFCALYEQYKVDLYRYAVYRLGSREDAEDAVQDAVLDAWKQIGNLRSPEAFRSWIFRILYGCCGRKIKDLIREREKSEAAGGMQNTAVPPDPGETASTRMSLEKAFGLIDDQTREMVLLSVIGGMNSNEIAGMTGLAPGSVRSRMSRGLKVMREYLEQ